MGDATTPATYANAGADAPCGAVVEWSRFAPYRPGGVWPGGLGGWVVAVAFPLLWADYYDWLRQEGRAAPQTIAVYRRIAYDFTGHLAHGRHPKTWDRATAADLREFLDRPAQTGPRRGQPLSPRYRANVTSTVKGLYAYAAAAGLIGRDPMVLVRAPKVGEDQPRAFEAWELAAVLDAADRDLDDRLAPMVWLAYGCVLRSHAIAALRMEDFHPRPRPGRLRVVRKGRPGWHWVDLHEQARRALDRYLRRPPPRAAGDPLFGHLAAPHTPLRPATVSRLLRDLIRDRAGLDRGSAHWLRHTGATFAVEAEQGANLEHVRELLDHLDSRTTRRYIAGARWRVREHAVDLIPDPRQPAPREVGR